MKVSTDPRVDKQIRALSEEDNARIVKVIELFQENGFNLTETHLKKLTRGLWELRAGGWRLFFGIIINEATIVNIFLKKRQKAPAREIKLALKRLREYL